MNVDINRPKTENSAGVISVKIADINNVESVENGILKMKSGFTLKKIDVTTGKAIRTIPESLSTNSG